MKKLIAILLIIMLLSTALFAAADQPSPWAQDVIAQIDAEKLVDSRMQGDYQTAISRRDFAYLGVVIYQQITGQDCATGSATFSDSDDEYVLKAKNNGIVNGYEDGSFRPDQSITRQELAVLFINTLAAAKQPLEIAEREIFKDDEDVAGWAKKSVYTARGLGVVNGVGDNLYNPLGTATREQALLMFKRVVDQYAQKTAVVEQTAATTAANTEESTSDQQTTTASDQQTTETSEQVTTVEMTQPTSEIGPGQVVTLRPESPMSDPIPDVAVRDFSAPTLTGSDFDLADHRDEVVVLNFFSGQCQPCFDQLVTLKTISQTSTDYQIVGVDLAYLDDMTALKHSARRYDIDYPVLLDDGSLAAYYRVTALPTTVVIADGKVVAYYVGSLTVERFTALLAETGY